MNATRPGLLGKLRGGEVAVGVSIDFPDAGLAEFLGRLGFDAVVVDGEHGVIDDRVVRDLAIACDLAGCALLLRVDADPAALERYVHLGATGFQVPRADSVDRVRMVADAIKYAPVGRRGLGSSRASSYGQRGTSVPDFMADENERTAILVQIEDRAGVAALPGILALGVVDAVLIGALDLSNDLGIPGQTADPRVVELVDEVIRISRAARVPFGLGAYDEATTAAAIARGAGYLLTGVPRLLASAARHVLR